MRIRRSLQTGAALLSVAVAVAACSESTPLEPAATATPLANILPEPAIVKVCVVGPAGTYDYTVAAPDGKGNYPAGASFSLAAGDCTTAFVRPSPDSPYSDSPFGVTATQVGAPTDVVLDSVGVDMSSGVRYVVSGPGATADPINFFHGATITFYNTLVPPPPPPPTGGGQGCTPGYWKQSQHFYNWPSAYKPGDLFSAYFENAFPGMTLLQVLGQGGGGLNALGRHTVAALLNGASGKVSYGSTDADVIAAFNAVFPGGDYEGQKNIFAAGNESGCPL